MIATIDFFKEHALYVFLFASVCIMLYRYYGEKKQLSCEPVKEDMGEFEFNFKLVIIDALLDQSPSFQAVVDELRKRNDEWYDQDYDEDRYNLYKEEAYGLLEKVMLTSEDLAKVELLCFDGGLDVYELIDPYWDGEDECFDVHSISGIDRLPNLKEVNYISIIDEPLLYEIKKRGIKVS